MNENLINDHMKTYLIACLVSGIHVEQDQETFLPDLITYMNSLEERTFWAVGDHDGVIIHDKFDVPILALRYNGKTLKFTVFTQDGEETPETNVVAGLMLINIIGFITELGIEHQPECMRVAKTQVSTTTQISPDDWAL